MKKQEIFELIKLHTPANIKTYIEKVLPHGQWETPIRYRCGNIYGEAGQSFCFDLTTGYAIDFSTDFKGDIINIIAEQYNLKPMEAAKKVAADWGLIDTQLGGSELVEVVAPQLPTKTKTPPAPDADDYILPVPSNTQLIVGGDLIGKFGQPKKVYSYCTKENELLFYVVRFEHYVEGKLKKEFFPHAFSKKGAWVRKLPARTIYGLQNFKDKQLFIICEGEKAADAAQKLCPWGVAISWAGGSSAVKLTDWTPLEKQNVFVWRDNDLAGLKAQNDLMPILHKLGCTIRYFKDEFFGDKPSGWDAADCDPAIVDIEVAIREMSLDYGEKKKIHKPVNPYFKVLGMIGTNYSFYNYLGGLIFEGDHSKLNKKFFLQLTSGNMNYWYKAYGEETQNKHGEVSMTINWDDVAGDFFEQSQRKGQFDITSVRGAGTWWDNGRLVTHLGNFLNVDGEQVQIQDFDTKYVYLKRGEVMDKIHDAMKPEEIQDLYKLLQRFNWDSPQSAALLLGWMVVAPICGALEWRPHLYIIGMSGSGKSTIYENIMIPALGAACLPLAGRSTTEAGLRQKANGDALPVIFEEFENEGSMQAKNNNDKIIELARLASSFSKGKMLKGDKGQGSAKEYSVNASFCFFSISQSVEHYADQNRITPLSLKPHKFKDKEELAEKRIELVQELHRVIGDKQSTDYSHRFVSTSIRNVRKINEAWAVFREQGLLNVAKFDPRHSDQIGMLLAGYWVGVTGEVPTKEEAKQLLLRETWDMFIPAKDQRNESRLCALIAEEKIRIDNEQPNNSHVYSRTIGQLVEYLASPSSYSGNGVGVVQHPDYEKILPEVAISFLSTLGLRIEGGFVYISSKSKFIRNLLEGTQFQTDWINSLKAVEGAMLNTKVMYFGGGLGTARAIGIPVEQFLSADILE